MEVTEERYVVCLCVCVSPACPSSPVNSFLHSHLGAVHYNTVCSAGVSSTEIDEADN